MNEPNDALKSLREARTGTSRIEQVERKPEEMPCPETPIDEAKRRKLETEYKDVDVSSDDEPAPKRVRRRGLAIPSAATPSAASTAPSAVAPVAPKLTKPPEARSCMRPPQDAPKPLYDLKQNLLDASRGCMPPLDKNGSFWFYYIDVHEEVAGGSTKVMLFGKIINAKGEYRNCCVVVERMYRNVFFVLTNQSGQDANVSKAAQFENLKDAFEEVNDLCVARGIRKLKCSPVTRSYFFEKILPCPYGKLQCFKVQYDFCYPALPDNINDGKHFCQVFGAHNSASELLLMKRRIKGPMWMKIKINGTSVKRSFYSHCPYEVHIDDQKSIETFDKNATGQCFAKNDAPKNEPPLQVLTLGMKLRSVKHDTSEYQEPTVITMNYHPRLEGLGAMREEQELFHFVFTHSAPEVSLKQLNALDYRFSSSNTQVIRTATEEDMLRRVIDKVAELDPDVIVQHNAYGLGLDILAQRLCARSRGDNLGWHRLSRVDRKNEKPPIHRSTGMFIGRKLTVGRMVCDTLLAAREFLGKQTSYELELLSTGILRDQSEPTFTAWTGFPSNEQEWMSYVYHTLVEAKLTFRLLGRLQVLPLTKQLTTVAGNVWNNSLQNKRAERNEYLLMHEFFGSKHIYPDKKPSKFRSDFDDDTGGGKQKKSKAAYSGGLVLEPKPGLYDDFIMMLDFNSLYPSLIREFNICFTTVQRPRGDLTSMEEQDLLAQTILPTSTKSQDDGILPRVIHRLVMKRIEAKKEKKEIKQKALKLIANSMYGCLGFSNSRFYAKPLAAMITSQGRKALMETIEKIKSLQYEVVYGDTDSVFIRSFTKDYEEAMTVAQKIKSAINSKYKKLEIDIDGIFVRLLLLKKKKYAGIKVNDWKKGEFEQEYKGLDLVRRDWCELSKRMGREILTKVLSRDTVLEEAVEWVHEYIRTVATEINEKKVGLHEYVITKALTKAPHLYPDAKHQPHVQVAMRMLANGATVVGNQEIPYIICKTGDASMALCARHPTEVAVPDSALEVDVDWYKKQQLHPPMIRLLDPVDGTDAAKIAECLGLDGTRFIVSEAYKYNSDVSFDTILDPTRRFRQLDLAFDISCPFCKERISLKETLALNEKLELKEAEAYAQCAKCTEFIHPTIVENQSILGIRQLLSRYAICETKCTEGGCKYISRDVSLRGLGQRCESRDDSKKCKATCEKTFGEQDLQNQLDLLGTMFSVANENQTNENAYPHVMKYVDDILEHSEYSWIRKDFFVSIFG